ncbi:MAG: methyltransferase [Balneolaceae bacterium]
MMCNTEFSTAINHSFSGAVDYYHEHSKIQKEAAERLANALDPWLYSIPEGELLEIGCGTGFFTDHLIRMFPKRDKVITDLSPKMVDFCKNRFSEQEQITFDVLNAEEAEFKEDKYGLIVGNYVTQWFRQPAITLEKLSKSLKVGGLMLLAFPGDDSYPEWKKYCLDLGIPYTANTFPDIEQLVIHLSMGPVQVDFYEDQTRESHDDVYSFFRHLKNSGTSANLEGKSLSYKQLKLLNDHWVERQGGSIEVTYHNVFLALKRVA